jgi:acetyltransferase-like isoleucine patch superfamily enzyme
MILKKLLANTIGKIFPISYARFIGVKIGNNCRLINVKYSTEPYLISIGNHVSATRVHFETHDGGVWCFRDKYPDIDIVKPINIGNNVYLGDGCLILPGVNIGDNSIIGARSVVTKDIPANTVCAGIPAKQIKTLEEYKEKAIKTGNNTKSMTFEKKKKYYLSKYQIKK